MTVAFPSSFNQRLCRWTTSVQRSRKVARTQGRIATCLADNEVKATLCRDHVLVRTCAISVNELLSYRFTKARRHSVASITCCIAFGNDHEYLGEALKSLALQTVKPAQVLIGVDNSTAGVFTSFPRSDNVCCVHFKGKNGPFVVMDRLIRSAETDYVVVMDSDDIAHPNRLQCLLAAAKRYKLDSVGSAAAYFTVAARAIREVGVFPSNPRRALSTQSSHAMLYPTMLIRRSKYFEIGGFANFDYFGMDTEFTLRAIHMGRSRNLPQLLYLKRVRPGSLTNAIDTGFDSVRRRAILDFTEAQYQRLYGSHGERGG